MRNRRQHKKLHTGHFQVLAFEVKFSVSHHWMDPKMDALYDRFIEQAIEGNGLACGGGASSGSQGNTARFVVEKVQQQKKYPWKYVSASVGEQERARVEHWLAAQPEIVAYEIGPMIDLWYTED